MSVSVAKSRDKDNFLYILFKLTETKTTLLSKNNSRGLRTNLQSLRRAKIDYRSTNLMFSLLYAKSLVAARLFPFVMLGEAQTALHKIYGIARDKENLFLMNLELERVRGARPCSLLLLLLFIFSLE